MLDFFPLNCDRFRRFSLRFVDIHCELRCLVVRMQSLDAACDFFFLANLIGGSASFVFLGVLLFGIFGGHIVTRRSYGIVLVLFLVLFWFLLIWIVLVSANMNVYSILKYAVFAWVWNVSMLRQWTYANNVLMSPRTRATNSGTPAQAGTKYNRAGCACLNRCIIKMVTSKPRK